MRKIKFKLKPFSPAIATFAKCKSKWAKPLSPKRRGTWRSSRPSASARSSSPSRIWSYSCFRLRAKLTVVNAYSPNLYFSTSRVNQCSSLRRTKTRGNCSRILIKRIWLLMTYTKVSRALYKKESRIIGIYRPHSRPIIFRTLPGRQAFRSIIKSTRKCQIQMWRPLSIKCLNNKNPSSSQKEEAAPS